MMVNQNKGQNGQNYCIVTDNSSDLWRKRNLKLGEKLKRKKNRKKTYKVWEVAGHFELFEGRGQ